MTQVISERGWRCEKCGRSRNDDGTMAKIYGHHIHELKDGGELLDRSNVQLLCAPCHGAVTIAARKKRYGLG